MLTAEQAHTAANCGIRRMEVGNPLMLNGGTMIDSFQAFKRFVEFYSGLFAKPGLLADADCRQSYKDYVPRYYRNLFGGDAQTDSARHIRWYRRLAVLFELPRGSRILDYGGGYGMDSIFLASLGYNVVFYEITPHHIGVARWFADRFETVAGKLPIQFCLAGTDAQPSALDAVFANEVAHHIEPAQRVFDDAARMLRASGDLFLLEPNYLSLATQAFFFRVRGFQTTKWLTNEATGERYLWGNEHIRPIWAWNKLARAAGFNPMNRRYIVPWFQGPRISNALSTARGIERWPSVRDIVASHVSLHYRLAKGRQPDADWIA